GTEFPIELSINAASLLGRPFFTAYLRDITERKQAEARLQLSQTRLATLIANFQAGVLVEDENRRILLTNQPFCDQFSIPAPPESMVGYDCSGSAEQSKHLFTDPETFVQRIDTLLRERRVAAAEEIHMRDGQVLERDYIPIVVENVYRGHLWMYRNVTARCRLTEELKRSNQALQEFASIASHDLQEPLRKIQAFGGRLKTKVNSVPEPPADCVDYLDRMLNAAARMQTLIDGLLTFSRITTQKRPIQATNLNEIINGVLNDLEERIHQSKASIIVGSLPTVEADSLQMRQLFQNLLGNALKFQSATKTPVITVQVTTRERGTGKVRITVTDNGIGFDARHATRIFEVFERLHSRSEYEGTGIGLALCRRIVERHGGSISAHSVPGEGASFVIDLPCGAS
ncbi:MAG: hypothetical protein H8F28_25985, partial [Fibrella sp.]|nr:hypothetical protein [Armatimonadota bacterium]